MHTLVVGAWDLDQSMREAYVMVC